ncbi:MAG: hypothetical protein R3349_06415 [Geminicoccaceae bacterium]|nr:hypothetical protein [Geminicoccaceae bacterium]
MRSSAEPTDLRRLDHQALAGAIVESHANGDLARLAALFAEAGARAAAEGDSDPACFLWTQAWIFALDAGDEPLADELETRLDAHGRLGRQPPTVGRT